ncbi:hypothetical protein Cadr_000009739 [Camelus dromedarius]|uniref:Secreted protein n=1 Tax=Camelus dromedarius TaxID=9838 RepID=A0A5N4DIS5_CAMDR|nr:hypothetical protein Cadr_000009739 [Camelus dromedarius]
MHLFKAVACRLGWMGLMCPQLWVQQNQPSEFLSHDASCCPSVWVFDSDEKPLPIPKGQVEPDISRSRKQRAPAW